MIAITRTTYTEADKIMNTKYKMFDRKTNKMFWTQAVFIIRVKQDIVWIVALNSNNRESIYKLEKNTKEQDLEIDNYFNK